MAEENKSQSPTGGPTGLPASAGSVAGCCLREGPHDGTLIEIEPTMQMLRHKGDKYHRVNTATRIVNGASYRIYLWEHWSPQNDRADSPANPKL